MQRESIHQIREYGHESGQETEPDPHRAQDRQDPMVVPLGGPTVPEESEGNEYASGDEWWETIFCFHFAFGAHLLDEAIGCYTKTQQTDEGADANAEIGQADRAGRESVLALVKRCEGGEQEVEVAVDDSLGV